MSKPHSRNSNIYRSRNHLIAINKSRDVSLNNNHYLLIVVATDAYDTVSRDCFSSMNSFITEEGTFFSEIESANFFSLE